MAFGEHRVVNDLSFEVNKGDVFGLLGANGAGKTTTIRTLLALLEPTSGTLLVDGERYQPARSADVGYLPEERGLYRNETVLDTMIYFGVLHGLAQSEARARAVRYLERVGLPDKAEETLLSLSGGQQQKVQLGVTILHEPALMILDEPTEALDPVNRSLLMNIINERRDQGATIILVTHRMEEVEQLCNRILLLKNGERQLYGTVPEVKAKFGTKLLAVKFTGQLPKNPALYEVTKALPQSAELKWRPGVETDQVLKFLANAPDLHLNAFSVEQPSLNDIFIELYQTGGEHG